LGINIKVKRDKLKNFIQSFISVKNKGIYKIFCILGIKIKVKKDKFRKLVQSAFSVKNKGIHKFEDSEKTEDDIAIEIWIEIDKEPFCYYLFPYDEAVIECD
jgi:hypothetical protein